jgi:hypothetical protein
VGRAVGRGLKATARAAGTSARVVAIRAQIAARQSQVARLYARIGETYYKGLKSGAPRTRQRDIKLLVQKTDGLHEKIEALKARERSVRGKR